MAQIWNKSRTQGARSHYFVLVRNVSDEFAFEFHQVVAPPVHRFTEQLESVEFVFEFNLGIPAFVPL